MFYNYTPLFKTLYSKGITKKQLREVLLLSPATMARINASEPIATETLGRICDYLQCSLDKVFNIEPEKKAPGRWDSLNISNENDDNITFRIYLYFLLNQGVEGPALYLYGYAMPFIYEESDMDTWYCTYGTGNYHQFCTIDGTLYKSQLNLFLDAASNRYPLAKIMDVIKIKIKGIKPEHFNQIKQTQIANGKLIYRPPFILPPENTYLDCQAEFKPLLSYEQESTLCESLYGINKRQYYTTEYGIDANKAQLLWSFFSENLPLHHNLNEIARLGNFEILTRLQNSSQEPVQCEVWRDGKEQLGAKIILSPKLTGKYILRVRLFNGRNPISDNAINVDAQNKNENPVFIPLNEDFDFSELELWSTIGTDRNEPRLLYQSSTPYIRQIALQMNLLERSIMLEDRWSLAMKKQGQPVNTHVTFFSNVTNEPLIGRPDEVWLSEEKQIQKDFHALLGNGKLLHDRDAFFPKGSDNVVEFLSWLNKCLEVHPQATRVLLFDPYINDTAILKFVRNIRYINIEYDIITDSYPAKRDRANKINQIKALSVTLPYIAATCKLCIRSFTKTNGTLHDRILIIADNMNTIVYVLSNSLDSMANHHSSIVTAVKPEVALQVFNAYVKLVQNTKQDEIVTLYNSQKPGVNYNRPDLIESNALNCTKTAADKNRIVENSYSKDDFLRDYENDTTIRKALQHLAVMSFEDNSNCVKSILLLDKENESKRLEKLLKVFLNEKLPTVSSEDGIYILNQNYLAKQDFDFSGELIKAAENAIRFCFEFRKVLSYSYDYAIRILWSISPNNFIAFLEKLIKEQSKNETNGTMNAMPTTKTLLIYSMIEQITKEMYFLKTEKEQQSLTLAKSEIAYLRALFAAKSIWPSEAFLNHLHSNNNWNDQKDKEVTQYIQERCNQVCQNLNTTEAATALIHLIVNLQTESCRDNQSSHHIQTLKDLVISAYVNTLLKSKKSNTSYLIQQLAPLNMRNPADICQIVEMLCSAKHLNAEQGYEILLHFWKLVYVKENKREREYYNEDTIQHSNLLASAILNLGRKQTVLLLKEINKQSRNQCSNLYDPLLHSKNYNTWKKSVDQLACLLITERYIVSQDSTFTMGKGEAEYQKLTQNYDEILDECSVTYKIWKYRYCCKG